MREEESWGTRPELPDISRWDGQAQQGRTLVQGTDPNVGLLSYTVDKSPTRAGSSKNGRRDGRCGQLSTAVKDGPEGRQ